MDNYFSVLNKIDVNGKTQKKNGLTYLSWAWAWAEVKKLHPDATYTIYESADGWNYHTDGRTCWVKTGVTVSGIEHIEYLPVMDFRNASIRLDKVTSFDVNKTIQRSLTKALARHGLGLYIYAGEDLPEDASGDPADHTSGNDLPEDASGDPADHTSGNDGAVTDFGRPSPVPPPKCVICKNEITIPEHDYSVKYFGRPLCRSCQKSEKRVK